MSGCYRCGLPEGSDCRLCETCYRNRFHRGLLVMDAAPPHAPSDGEGLELSARVQTIVLGGGALAYIGIICFVVTCFGHMPGVTAATASYEFYSATSETAIIQQQRALGSLSAHRAGAHERAARGEEESQG